MKAPSKSKQTATARIVPNAKIEIAEINATEQPKGLSKPILLNLFNSKRLIITIEEIIKVTAFQSKSALQSAK